MKRVLDYLLAESLNKEKLSAELKCRLHNLTADINKDIPLELPRKMRSTVVLYSKYKAVEYTFYLLYVSAIVLMDVLNDDTYQHLICFQIFGKLI